MRQDTLEGPLNEKQYQKIEFYDRGGMGEIYTAIDITSSQKKAIKVIPTTNNEEFSLLQREFDISTKLKHKNIVSTEYFSSFNKGRIKYIYSVMDFYNKGSLRNIINRQQHFSIEQALSLMCDLAEAIHYTHEISNLKVIHRDLKPENILIGQKNELRVCDFGLAKLVNERTRTKTFKGWGTFPYMSPESWMGDSNTLAMDIYSLGIIYYEILTLSQPFRGKDENEFRDQHLYQALPKIESHRKDIPTKLIELINKMVSKRPKARPKKASDIISSLQHLQSYSPINDNNTVNHLAKKASKKISTLEKERLANKKALDELTIQQNFLNYSINSFFEDIIRKIEKINFSLEREKITYKKSTQHLTVKFINNEFSVFFFPISSIQEYIKYRKEKHRELQKRDRKMLFVPFSKSYIEKDNIQLVGQASLSSNSYKEKGWGYNLLLHKDKENDQDLYGRWEVVWFDDHALIRKSPLEKHYPLGIPEFYQEYEYGRANTMHVRKMYMADLENENVIDNLLDKLLD